MKNLIYLFALTLVFGLTSCEKEELEPEIQPQTLSTTDTTGTNNSNTGGTSTGGTTTGTTGGTATVVDTNLYTIEGDVVDLSSPLYAIINKTYELVELNNVVQNSPKSVSFTNTLLTSGKYFVGDGLVSSEDSEWWILDQAGTTFKYRWLEMKTLNTSGGDLYIDTYDAVSGDLLITFKENPYAKTDSILLKLR